MLSNSQVLSVYKTAEKAIRRTCASFGTHVSDDTLADLQQGTLERLIEKYDASRGTPDQLAWRIASNEAISYLRGRGKGTAIKNDDQSLTVEDEDGTETIADVADDSSNPFDLLAARQLDAEIVRGIDGLTDGLKAGVKAALSDETMSGSDRIAAMRARDALADSLRSSHFPSVREGKGKGKRAKSPKRAPKVEPEAVEVPTLRRLGTVVRIEMELMHCVKAPLVVLGPA